jgi:2-(1,2-epoxy-1,2-dihydrophenyl)acetyl-CoA isomerase
MEAGTFDGFRTDSEDPGVLVVTFDRPESMNASTIGMKRDLVELLTQAQMDDGVRVLVFTGSGPAFWAGDDMKSYAAGEPSSSTMAPIPGGHHNALGTYDALRTISQAVNVAVRNLDKLTIAAVNGFAIQTGFSFALACDFRLAARSARLGSATLRFALLPDEGGQWLLVQHMGVAKTMDFLMRKRIVTADEALELGLVHEVTEDADLAKAALELARELAEGPQVAMRLLKRSIYGAAELSFPHALEDIATKTGISDHHPDARAGLRSFVEKQPPRFNEWLAEG